MAIDVRLPVCWDPVLGDNQAEEGKPLGRYSIESGAIEYWVAWSGAVQNRDRGTIPSIARRSDLQIRRCYSPDEHWARPLLTSRLALRGLSFLAALPSHPSVGRLSLARAASHSRRPQLLGLCLFFSSSRGVHMMIKPSVEMKYEVYVIV